MTHSPAPGYQPLPLLDALQFSRSDVLAVTGIPDGALQGILNRQHVTLREHNPGTGRRRLFCGSDVLKIATAHGLSAQGFPLRWVYLAADAVAQRAAQRLMGLDHMPRLWFATYPNAAGDDWVRVPLHDGMREQPKLPPFYQVLHVDQLIDEILAKLKAVVEEKPMPSFDIPPPPPPEKDWLRAWAKDDQGNDVLVGLTLDETQFYQRYQAKDLLSRTSNSFPWPSVEAMHEDAARWLTLHDKHEAARFRRIEQERKKNASKTAVDGS